MSNPLKRLSAAQLRHLQEQLHLQLTVSSAENAQMGIPDHKRLEILGYRLYTAARDLAAIDIEVVERDLLESLPDATGPAELQQIMQFIQ
jgi:hypothetical protein